MSKFCLQEDQMNGSAIVAEAREMTRFLVNIESRGPGDTDNAMRRIGRRYGLSYAALWSLRYRSPKDLMASVYFKIISAHEAMCEQQRKKLEHELAIAKARGAHPDLIRTVADLGGVEQPK